MALAQEDIVHAKRKKEWTGELKKINPTTEEIQAAIKKLHQDGVADLSGQALENLTTEEYTTIADQIRVTREDATLERETRDQQSSAIRKAVKEAKRDRAEQEKNEALLAARQRAEEDAQFYSYPQNYVCGAQIGVFMGDRWIDNLVSIEYTKTVNKTPVYGYASEKFDAVSKGTVIVNGTFSLVYSDESYLPSLMQRFMNNNTIETVASIPDPIQRMKELFWHTKSSTEQNLTDPLVMDYSHEGVDGVVKPGFDIHVVFGIYDYLQHHIYKDGSVQADFDLNMPITIIQDIHLTSQSIIVGPTGEPIGETYTFFAKDTKPFRRRAKAQQLLESSTAAGQLSAAPVIPDSRSRSLSEAGSTLGAGGLLSL